MRAITWSGTTANILRFDRGGGDWVQRWSDGGSVDVRVRGEKIGRLRGFFSRKHSDGVFLVPFFWGRILG